MAEEKNRGSFSETVTTLIDTVNDAMGGLTLVTKSLTSDQDSVSIDIKGRDGKTKKTHTLPTYGKVIRDGEATRKAVNALLSGEGVIVLSDGTKRKIKATAVAIAPDDVSELTAPKSFMVDSNFFFEDMMFPRIKVNYNLKGKIDDFSDRVLASRIILDARNKEVMTFFKETIPSLKSEELEYIKLKQLLSDKSIAFYEDKEEVAFPILTQKVDGSFLVTNTSTTNGVEYLELNTLSYNEVDRNGNVLKSVLLKVGDKVRFEESVLDVVEVDQATKRIRVRLDIGGQYPFVESKLEIYADPFKEKVISVGVGFNEVNIIYFKAVNEEYNLSSKRWSAPTWFLTNELINEDGGEPLDTFYGKVADFGARMLSEVKEGKVYAYNGHKPNTPILSSDYFAVARINTQLDYSLDNDDITKTSKNMELLRSRMSSLKQTIATQKDELQYLDKNNHEERTKKQSQIDSNVKALKQSQVEYNSLLQHLNDLAIKNGITLASPKYRLRGFFPIPEERNGEKIIAFDISYRYLKLDNNGVDLKTYRYGNETGGVNGVYTDWNTYRSKFLEKVYDEKADRFVWKEGNISDGGSENINQIDIPIQRGEKVEVRVRAISEAGYPENPLISDWSNAVICEFPNNLSVGSRSESILSSARQEAVALQIDSALQEAGVYNHLEDENALYRHKGSAISVELSDLEKLGEDLGLSFPKGLKTLPTTLDLQSYLTKAHAHIYLLTKAHLSISKENNDFRKKLAELEEKIKNGGGGGGQTPPTPPDDKNKDRAKVLFDTANGIYYVPTSGRPLKGGGTTTGTTNSGKNLLIKKGEKYDTNGDTLVFSMSWKNATEEYLNANLSVVVYEVAGENNEGTLTKYTVITGLTSTIKSKGEDKIEVSARMPSNTNIAGTGVKTYVFIPSVTFTTPEGVKYTADATEFASHDAYNAWFTISYATDSGEVKPDKPKSKGVVLEPGFVADKTVLGRTYTKDTNPSVHKAKETEHIKPSTLGGAPYLLVSGAPMSNVTFKVKVKKK